MKLTEFVLPRCPYCRRAAELLEELRAEKPEYAAVGLEVTDESARPDIAGRFDYYYVPSFFLGGEKLYEADPSRSREEDKRLLDEMLGSVLRRGQDRAADGGRK